MNDQEKYTLDEAHEFFAKRLNGEVWELLNKSDRTIEECERMVFAAFASHYHWLHAGSVVNRQRGEWLIARVYTVLEDAYLADMHATRCLELTREFKAKMSDFDVAYAYEGVARARALGGDLEGTKKYLSLAEKAGNEIADSKDRGYFLGDFKGGKWFGIR
jgi:hypothetical protein